MRLKPSEIRFSQDSISSRFDKRSRHSYKTIGETLDDLLTGKSSIEDIPTITIQSRDGKWYTADNRRLWVFKKLEERKKCKTIPVCIGWINPRKFTSYNDGASIGIRGDAGGRHWLKWRVQDQENDTKAKIQQGSTILFSTNNEPLNPRGIFEEPNTLATNLVIESVQDDGDSTHISNKEIQSAKTQENTEQLEENYVKVSNESANFQNIERNIVKDLIFYENAQAAPKRFKCENKKNPPWQQNSCIRKTKRCRRKLFSFVNSVNGQMVKYERKFLACKKYIRKVRLARRKLFTTKVRRRCEIQLQVAHLQQSAEIKSSYKNRNEIIQLKNDEITSTNRELELMSVLQKKITPSVEHRRSKFRLKMYSFASVKRSRRKCLRKSTGNVFRSDNSVLETSSTNESKAIYSFKTFCVKNLQDVCKNETVVTKEWPTPIRITSFSKTLLVKDRVQDIRTKKFGLFWMEDTVGITKTASGMGRPCTQMAIGRRHLNKRNEPPSDINDSLPGQRIHTTHNNKNYAFPTANTVVERVDVSNGNPIPFVFKTNDLSPTSDSNLFSDIRTSLRRQGSRCKTEPVMSTATHNMESRCGELVPSLKPSEVKYSSQIISVYYGNSRIGELLDDLITGTIEPASLKTVTVILHNKYYVTLNNTVLWVLKKAERFGKYHAINVPKMHYGNKDKPLQGYFTAENLLNFEYSPNPGGKIWKQSLILMDTLYYVHMQPSDIFYTTKSLSSVLLELISSNQYELQKVLTEPHPVVSYCGKFYTLNNEYLYVLKTLKRHRNGKSVFLSVKDEVDNGLFRYIFGVNEDIKDVLLI